MKKKKRLKMFGVLNAALLFYVGGATITTIGLVGSGADFECDGVDDHIEFQEAICNIKGETFDHSLSYSDGKFSCGFKHPGRNYEVYPSGSGSIHVLPGTYTFNRQLRIYSNIEIIGTDKETTILKLQDEAISFYEKYNAEFGWQLENGQSGFIRCYFCSNIRLSSLTLDGNKQNQLPDTIDDEYSYGRFTIYTEVASNVTVEDCIIRDFQNYCINYHGEGGTHNYGNTHVISTSEIYGCDWDGITIDKQVGAFVYGNYVHDNGRHGINIVTGSEYGEVYDNIIINNGYYYDKENDGNIEGNGCGIMIQNNQLYDTREYKIFDNNIEYTDYHGICVNSVHDVQIYNNSLISDGEQNWCIYLGIQSDNVGGSYNIEIYDNHCEYEKGFYIKNGTENYIHDNNISVVANTYGIKLTTDSENSTDIICGNVYSGNVRTGSELYFSNGRFPDMPCSFEPDPFCDTGILQGNVCCLESCGECGGSGCSSRTGGQAGCCAGTITTNNNSCAISGPPCIVNDEIPPGSDPDPDCDTGILQGNVCCMESCGECGGSGCASRNGGQAGCCTGTITANNNSCEILGPPCIVDEEIPPSSDPDPDCDTGILRGNVCCMESCGECGGSGCASRNGGQAGCCTGTITANNNSCALTGPPCILE